MARNFGSRINRVGNVLVHNATKIIRKAAMAAANEVVLRTPVKTGAARINWKLSVGTPRMNLLEGPNTPKVDTNRQIASTKALMDAANKIKTWKVGKGSIFIANPVEYIDDLDEGSSKQARGGMTLFAVTAARDILRKARLLRGQ